MLQNLYYPQKSIAWQMLQEDDEVRRKGEAGAYRSWERVYQASMRTSLWSLEPVLGRIKSRVWWHTFVIPALGRWWAPGKVDGTWEIMLKGWPLTSTDMHCALTPRQHVHKSSHTKQITESMSVASSALTSQSLCPLDTHNSLWHTVGSVIMFATCF